jgi:hypothetical protein
VTNFEKRNDCLWCQIVDEVNPGRECLLGHPPAADDALDFGHPAMLTPKEPAVHPLERGNDCPPSGE